MIYGLRRMIYLPCGKYDISVPSYFLYISPAARLQKVYHPHSGYHIEDISPVPQGTDIINLYP